MFFEANLATTFWLPRCHKAWRRSWPSWSAHYQFDGGKLFYSALFSLVPDSPADHQYGYAPPRSRRDAILQVEAWLDRLRNNKVASATTLFDLTKAFDTLNQTNSIRSCNCPPAAEKLLLDLHQRLRIHLQMDLAYK